MALQECGLNLGENKKELKPHGTAEFPCAGYAAGLEEPIPWHWHEEMEIIYLWEGAMKLQVPGKLFHLKKGDLIFINSNVLHFAEAEEKAESGKETACHIRSFVFSPLFIAGGGTTVFAKKYIKPVISCIHLDACLFCEKETGGEQTQAHESFLTAFEAVLKEPEGYEFIIREKLSRICLCIYRMHKKELSIPSREVTQDSIRMEKMLGFIHGHYGEPITLAQIAKAADIGERECLRCFKRSMQSSPMQYLIRCRITRGAEMIMENPDANIAETAIQCGFDSPSNFSQVFKKYFKCTPREYRIS